MGLVRADHRGDMLHVAEKSNADASWTRLAQTSAHCGASANVAKGVVCRKGTAAERHNFFLFVAREHVSIAVGVMYVCTKMVALGLGRIVAHMHVHCLGGSMPVT